MNIIRENGFTAIDKLNMISVPRDIKKVTSEITINGAIIYEKPNKETGEAETVGAIRSVDGDIWGFTSHTLIECLDMVIDVFESGASSITLIPVANTSNAGRTFYQFKVTAVD
jgi:hypothetical protein